MPVVPGVAKQSPSKDFQALKIVKHQRGSESCTVTVDSKHFHIKCKKGTRLFEMTVEYYVPKYASTYSKIYEYCIEYFKICLIFELNMFESNRASYSIRFEKIEYFRIQNVLNK